jgi:hypothetical protein
MARAVSRAGGLGRHQNHRAFIDALFSNEEMLALFRRGMLDDVYARVQARQQPER